MVVDMVPGMAAGVWRRGCGHGCGHGCGGSTLPLQASQTLYSGHEHSAVPSSSVSRWMVTEAMTMAGDCASPDITRAVSCPRGAGGGRGRVCASHRPVFPLAKMIAFAG